MLGGTRFVRVGRRRCASGDDRARGQRRWGAASVAGGKLVRCKGTALGQAASYSRLNDATISCLRALSRIKPLSRKYKARLKDRRVGRRHASERQWIPRRED